MNLKGVEVRGVVWLSPREMENLQKQFTQREWMDIYRAAVSGGQITGSPLFNGAMGLHEGVILHLDPTTATGLEGIEKLFRQVYATET